MYNGKNKSLKKQKINWKHNKGNITTEPTDVKKKNKTILWITNSSIWWNGWYKLPKVTQNRLGK